MINNSKVAVIILTLNQREKTLRCLRSLSLVKYSPKIILLFDNGSKDETIKHVQDKFPSVITHYSPVNLGVASGRNASASIAKKLFDPEYFLFLDNDTTVKEDFLQKLVFPQEEDKSIAITTSKMKCHENTNLIFAAGGCKINFWLGTTRAKGNMEKDDGRFDQAADCISSGGCMLVKTSIFYEVGGFDPIFNPYGPEDLDFTFKVLSKSYRSVYIPLSVIYHDSEPARTSSEGEITEKYMAQKTKNWFVLLFRHASLKEKIVFTVFIAPIKFSWIFIKGIFKGNLKLPVAILSGFFAFTHVGEKNNTKLLNRIFPEAISKKNHF